jgi:hypothetical protein
MGDRNPLGRGSRVGGGAAVVTAAALGAAGAAVAAGDVALLAIAWRSQTVLSGVLGATGIPLVVLANLSGRGGGTAVAILVIALLLLIVGAAIYALGQAFERLLDRGDHDPDG